MNSCHILLLKISLDLKIFSFKKVCYHQLIHWHLYGIDTFFDDNGFSEKLKNKLRDKTRKKEIVLARQLAMYFSKELTKSSLKTIGLHFGGRDHTTVLHSCQTIDNYLCHDVKVRAALDVLKKSLTHR